MTVLELDRPARQDGFQFQCDTPQNSTPVREEYLQRGTEEVETGNAFS